LSEARILRPAGLAGRSLPAAGGISLRLFTALHVNRLALVLPFSIFRFPFSLLFYLCSSMFICGDFPRHLSQSSGCPIRANFARAPLQLPQTMLAWLEAS
jgi:hypothetical protein